MKSCYYIIWDITQPLCKTRVQYAVFVPLFVTARYGCYRLGYEMPFVSFDHVAHEMNTLYND